MLYVILFTSLKKQDGTGRKDKFQNLLLDISHF